MEWIGQNIWDKISRFRSDVYLEDISTGTIASGGHLGLDSNNKIVKAVDSGGDLTGITAGTGLSGTDLTGPVPTLNVDAAQAGITSLGTLSSLAVTSASDLGSSAITLTNADVDQKALYINAANTTANILDINATGATTGRAIYINGDNVFNGGIGIEVDLDTNITGTLSTTAGSFDVVKTGVTGDGITALIQGAVCTTSDTATNHANSTVNQRALVVSASQTNNQGTTTNKAVEITAIGADTNHGLDVTATDGTGGDIINRSSADDDDYCSISTIANGATTIKTIDDSGSLANLTLDIDGTFYMNNAGRSIFYKTGNTDDYFLIAVGENGDTKLTTHDNALAAAHLELEADGNIVLDSAGGLVLEPTSGITFDSATIEGIQLSSESFADSDAQLMTAAAINNHFDRRGFFEFAGYATGDGSNFMIADVMSGNKAPFLHDDTSVGSDGLTAVAPSLLLRVQGVVMPRAGICRRWVGHGTSAGSGDVDVSIFKYTPDATSSSNVSMALVKNTTYAAGGNNLLRAFSETSFSVAFAAGDILITGVKGPSAKAIYFNSVLEVGWTS